MSFAGEFFDVKEFAHLHIQLDLNRSLTMVVDVENPQQMVLASKLLSYLVRRDPARNT